MICILMIIAAAEAIAIKYLLDEKDYWKQVAMNQKEMMKKWWHEYE